MTRPRQSDSNLCRCRLMLPLTAIYSRTHLTTISQPTSKPKKPTKLSGKELFRVMASTHIFPTGTWFLQSRTGWGSTSSQGLLAAPFAVSFWTPRASIAKDAWQVVTQRSDIQRCVTCTSSTHRMDGCAPRENQVVCCRGQADRRTEPCHRRPADVLIPQWPSSSTDENPAGAKAALDFAVIDALGRGHIWTTANSSGITAATTYA